MAERAYGISPYEDIGNRIIEAIRGGVGGLAKGGEAAIETEAGSLRPGGLTPPTKAAPVAAAPAATTAPVQATPAAPAAATAHPAEGFPDEWAFAEHLVKSDPSGKKFKSWVDENQDRVSGMGYVEVADGPNKGRIVPTISRPETKQGGGYGLGDAVSQAESILGRRPTLGDMRDLAPILSNQRAADVESRKLAFEVEKFAKSNDMKDPMNVMKAAAIAGGVKKVTTYDENLNPTVSEVPNIEEGLRNLSKWGKLPPGVKVPEAPKVLTEQEARKRLTARNVTGKEADQYIANLRKAGSVQ
jgi:hypothetical protein